MRLEFEAAGLPVAVVGVNMPSAAANQGTLTARCSFPLFQDLAEVDVFGLQGGGKDDFFVYDREGRLAAWLPATGPLSTDLSTADGYQNVKNAVFNALTK